PERPLLTGEAITTSLSRYLAFAGLYRLAWAVGLLAVAGLVFRRRGLSWRAPAPPPSRRCRPRPAPTPARAWRGSSPPSPASAAPHPRGPRRVHRALPRPPRARAPRIAPHRRCLPAGSRRALRVRDRAARSAEPPRRRGSAAAARVLEPARGVAGSRDARSQA